MTAKIVLYYTAFSPIVQVFHMEEIFQRILYVYM